MKKKYFFSWTNLKWVIKELVNLYSDKPSYFSKKRIESSLAFLTGLWGMIYFFIINVDVITTSEVVLWSAVLFGMAGYTVKQIQSEKSNKPKLEENETI